MKSYGFELDQTVDERPKMGLIALQQDETIEGDFRSFFNSLEVDMYVSRVRSGLDVSLDTLGQMEIDLPAAASLLPGGRSYDVIGYGCTSGTSVIGANKTAQIIRTAAKALYVTDPLTATIAWCKNLGISRLALLTPYVASVNQSLRNALSSAGIETNPCGSFDVAEEATVVRISQKSIVSAAIDLCKAGAPEGVFLSCTNLRTFNAIPQIQSATGLPVVSSNLALCWHMQQFVEKGGEN